MAAAPATVAGAAPAVLHVPQAPVQPWWTPAPRCKVTEEAAQLVLERLAEPKKHAYSVCRLTCQEGQIYMAYIKLGHFTSPGVTIGQVPQDKGRQNPRSQIFTCLSEHSMEHVRKVILEGVAGRNVPELELEIVSGPHDFTPTDVPEATGLEPQLEPGFWVPVDVNLELAARSDDVEQLLALLDATYFDVCATNEEDVTALHLAALSGDARVAAAVVSIAEVACAGQKRPWQLEDGRTPLHLAVLFNSAELIQALLPVCDPSLQDRWGCTALQTAQDLSHSAAAAALQGRPDTLKGLCRDSICALLTRGASPAALESLRPMLRGLESQAVVPLNEYRALSAAAVAAPGLVDSGTVLRSMSCMECWYGDLFNRKCSAALPETMELIKVWDHLPSFQAAALPGGATEPDMSAAVLVEACASPKPPTVADKELFCERFHRRTCGILKDLDWSNVMVIGGMVLACLIADDEEYADRFGGADVDLYLTGAGFCNKKSFEERVCEVVESLPGSALASDVEMYIPGNVVGKHGGDLGLEFSEDTKNDRLIVTGVKGALADWLKEHSRRSLAPGDFILEVNNRAGVEKMRKQLTSIKPYPKGKGLGKLNSEVRWPSIQMKVRPWQAELQSISSAVIRTPSTLTVCLRKRTGEALPNVQVILSPYAGPAHLLFNTDIDCTALGFDGTHLYATPRAREAIRHRRVVARPEKYSVRGEWHTDARLLKYAKRGFSVVDLGVRPGARSPENEQIAAAAQAFLDLQQQGREEAQVSGGDGDGPKEPPPQDDHEDDEDDDAPDGVSESEDEDEGERRVQARLQLRADVNAVVDQVRKTGVDGASLLLLAGAHEGLRELMLAEHPLLLPGMTHDNMVDLVEVAGGKHRLRRPEDEAALRASKQSLVWYNDGYTTAAANLVIVNPAHRSHSDIRDGRLRGLEMDLLAAAAHVDVESDRFNVREWYEGLRQEDLRAEYVELDRAVWRGLDRPQEMKSKGRKRARRT